MDADARYEQERDDMQTDVWPTISELQTALRNAENRGDYRQAHKIENQLDELMALEMEETDET